MILEFAELKSMWIDVWTQDQERGGGGFGRGGVGWFRAVIFEKGGVGQLRVSGLVSCDGISVTGVSGEKGRETGGE